MQHSHNRNLFSTEYTISIMKHSTYVYMHRFWKILFYFNFVYWSYLHSVHGYLHSKHEVVLYMYKNVWSNENLNEYMFYLLVLKFLNTGNYNLISEINFITHHFPVVLPGHTWCRRRCHGDRPGGPVPGHCCHSRQASPRVPSSRWCPATRVLFPGSGCHSKAPHCHHSNLTVGKPPCRQRGIYQAKY